MLFQREPHRIFAHDKSGTLIAEITFPINPDGIIDIEHTFVDSSLRGQGVADQLMCAALAEIRKTGSKVTLSCDYAKRWFKKHPDQSDILA
jgi:hypothetical protein